MTHAEALQFLYAAKSATTQDEACQLLGMDRRQFQNRKAHFARMGIVLPSLPGRPRGNPRQSEMSPAEWDDIRRQAAEMDQERERAQEIEASRAAAELYRNGKVGRS